MPSGRYRSPRAPESPTAGRSADRPLRASEAAPTDDPFARYALDVGTWELDVAAGTLQVSPAWAAQLGYPLEELSGTTDDWFLRVPEGDLRRLRLAMRTHLEGLSSSFVAEYRLRTRDGDTRWMRARGRSSGTSAGALLSGHQLDITEERESMDILQGSELRFRTLVESSPDAIAVHREGRVVYANRRFGLLVGEDRPARLIDRLFLELVHGDDLQGVLDDSIALQDRRRTSVPCRQVRLARRDGGLVPVELTSLQLEFDDAPAIFVIARDVTERLQLQARLVETERLASLGLLAAGLAHEINNPLAYVSMNLESAVDEIPSLLDRMGALEGLLAAGTDPRRALDELRAMLKPDVLAGLLEGIREAYEGAVRIQGIVKDLRCFSRARACEPSPVDLVQVVDSALKMTGHEIKFRAAVVKHLAPVPLVLGDEGQLCQVMVNLLMNAAQAIPAGAASAHTVRVVTATDGGEVTIEIGDSGRGIAPDHLPRIFEPFFSTKDAGAGSGLGLSICRQIVEAHRGRIEVTSTVGRGSTFVVRMPALTATDDVARDHRRALPAEPAPAPRALPRPRVLVIDDEDNIVRALRHSLGSEYAVETATGGAAALELLRRDPGVDVVLCDLMMPDIAGPEVFARACARHPELASRFVFMTGGATSPETRHFAATTEHLVIDKPIEIKNLQRILHRLLLADQPRTVRQDRRNGRRFRAQGILGYFDTSDRVGDISVIDYSASGLRVAGTGQVPEPSSTSPVSLHLFRADHGERVQAQVRPVRVVPGGSETCLQIVFMTQASQRVYEDWLRRAERDDAGAAHPRG